MWNLSNLPIFKIEISNIYVYGGPHTSLSCLSCLLEYDKIFVFNLC